jgi:hypothetical protein
VEKPFSNPLTTQMPVPVSFEHKLLEPLQNYPVALWKCQASSQSMTNLEAETEEIQADVAEAREDDDERHNVRIVAKPQSPQGFNKNSRERFCCELKQKFDNESMET